MATLNGIDIIFFQNIQNNTGLPLSSVVLCCANRRCVYGKHCKRAMARQYQLQDDSRIHSKEIKELLGHIARHHEDLEKSFTDKQKEIFEKFHDCWSEYASLSEAAIFEYAFRLGKRIALDRILTK